MWPQVGAATAVARWTSVASGTIPMPEGAAAAHASTLLVMPEGSAAVLTACLAVLLRGSSTRPPQPLTHRTDTSEYVMHVLFAPTPPPPPTHAVGGSAT